MEPGDLRVNYFIRPQNFPKDQEKREFHHSSHDQLENPSPRSTHRKLFVENNTTNFDSAASAVASLVPDRGEPVKVWRDPHLVATTEIRHVESSQHGSFMAHQHPGSGGGQPPINPISYHRMNVNQAMTTSSNLIQSSTQGGMMQQRGMPMYGPGIQKNSNQATWRHRYPLPSTMGVSNISLSPVDPNIRDYRAEHEMLEKRMEAKLTPEQAVHQHFEESLRLAQQKRGWVETPKYPPEERLTIRRTPDKPPSDKTMYYGAVPPGSSMYLPQQAHANKKTDFPASSPTVHNEILRSEPKSMYGQLDLSERHRDRLPSPRIKEPMRVEPKVMYGQLDLTERSREPFPNPHIRELPREPERPYYSKGGAIHSKNVYNFPPAHINRVKVSSPAPPQIYGKPLIPASSGPATRNVYDSHMDMAPLSLTSKGSTKLYESPPSSSSCNSLPKHELRSADLTSYYMYSNNQSGQNHFHEESSPSSQLLLQKNEFQNQPLDLGGKRKSDLEPLSLDSKKLKTESIVERKFKDSQHYKYDNPNIIFDNSKSKVISISPMMLHQESLISLHQESPMALHQETALPLNQESPIALHRESPIVLHRESPLALHRESPIALHRESPIALHRESPIALHRESPIALHRESPISLNQESPVFIKQESVSLPRYAPQMVVQPPMSASPSSVPEIQPARSTPQKIEPVVKMQAAAEIAITPTKSSSPAPTTCGAPTTPTVKSGSIQKVPKKAWVHQWHHGEDSTNSEDSPVKIPPNVCIPYADKASSSDKTTLSVTTENPNNENTKDNGDNHKVARTTPSNIINENTNNQSSSASKNVAAKVKKKLLTEGKLSMVNGSAEEKITSSDSEQEKSDIPVTPKMKAKARIEKNSHEDSSSPTESEKYSESEESSQEKESHLSGQQSDNSMVHNSSSNKRRGRKPRKNASSKADKKKENPFKRPPINLLKKTGESFLQDGPCSEVSPKLGKCRECRWTPNNRSKKQSNIFCRFYAFRKLRYTKNGVLAIAGFSDPYLDPTTKDKSLWLPSEEGQPNSLDLDMGKFLISQIGDQFCELLLHERDAREINATQENKTLAWKRVVQGVREMCDVCDTTLFNYHWACGKCGFVVCIACYKARKDNSVKAFAEAGKERDEFQWLFCSNRQSHELEKLMLTQAIPGDILYELGKFLHDTRDTWKIKQLCGCPESEKYDSVATEEGSAKSIINGDSSKTNITPETKAENVSDEPREIPEKTTEGGNSDDSGDSHSTLRELLILGHKGEKEEGVNSVKNETLPQDNDAVKVPSNPEVTVSDQPKNDPVSPPSTDNNELKHFIRPAENSRRDKHLPLKVMTLSETTSSYPSVSHSWLCSGTLLRLLDPSNSENYVLFQDVWKRGQPVIVSNVASRLSKSLWTPESFVKDFPDMKNDLVNCMTGKLVSNQPIKKFWEGFDSISKRIKDEKGNPMLLKLKDWPPGEDFADMLPSRFKDLMDALPLTEYTHRDGRLNLAARLPDNFVKPDLGPKMYIGYGSGQQLDKGTTNLHLDISDAVNVMVHVGILKDCDSAVGHNEAVIKAIEQSDCDVVTINRVTQKKELPGALWHIYNARDADKIRDLLNKVALERGQKVETNHDAIHDQSWYLDQSLRKRLLQEYNVCGYSIIQCAGDAIFIPAGAPHQVRNLHNCIKITEDFVSPENVSHCFHLTEEFRKLSATHTNHEDKLQIKNIIYHAVKDALSVLLYKKKSNSHTNVNT